MFMDLKSGIIVAMFVISTSAFGEESKYESVDAVFEHLQDKDSVQIRTERGWTIAEDPQNMALYTFTTEGHAAHPAVFMRKVVQMEGKVGLRTWSICEAERNACEELSAEFSELNERIRQHMAQ